MQQFSMNMYILIILYKYSALNHWAVISTRVESNYFSKQY